MFYTSLDSPVGKLQLVGDESGLQFLDFPLANSRFVQAADRVETKTMFCEAVRQLQAYFDGELKDFSLDLKPSGTQFQREVWRALQNIPYGETRSYAEIAISIGNPKAVRAVGAANGRNPIAIVIPCHRVIGSDGSLTGFGGGLPIKQFLLNLEGARQGMLSL